MKYQTTDDTKPHFARAEYVEAIEDLDIIDDVLGGTRAMHKASKKYIKKWEKESTPIYDFRRTCEKFFEGTKFTLKSTIGMLFRKPLQMQWSSDETEAAFKDIWPNLDAAGTAGPIVMKRMTDMSARYGFSIALTDHPPVPKDKLGNPIVIHFGNEKQLGRRPRVALYNRRQAINWYVDTINEQSIITHLTLYENTKVRSGVFGVTGVHRYRDLRVVPNAEGTPEARWTLFELIESKNGGPDTFRIVGSGVFRNKDGEIADFLPIAIDYAAPPEMPMTAEVPLLGVAHANIAHWEKSTDINFYEKLCAFPQRVVEGELAPDPETGEQPTELPSGPGIAIQVEKGGSVSWDELEGKSLVQLKESRQEKLSQMGQMGSGFLTPDTRAAETATAKRLDKVGEQANVTSVGQGAQDAGNEILEHVSWFLGIPKEQAPTMAISIEFEGKKLSAQEMDSYGRLVAGGVISRETAWDRLEEGERLPTEFDREMEKQRLRDEAPAISITAPDAPPADDADPLDAAA